MEKNKNMDDATCLMFFYEILKAVDYIHSKDIMHRDIKPENVLVSDKGEIKLCDFGFCAPIDNKNERETMCGTKEYLAPEIMLGLL